MHRQHEMWKRGAKRMLAMGRTAQALGRDAHSGMVQTVAAREAAKAAMVAG